MPSDIILEQKKKEVNKVVDMIDGAASVVISDYQGLKVDEDTAMRKEMREAGVNYKVIKNSTLSHAFEQLGYDDFEEFFKGPSAIACSEDPVAPSKVLSKYAKEYDCISIKAGLLNGEKMDMDRINKLAALPSKEELIAKVVGGISAPLYGLVNVLNGNLKGLAVALNAIVEKKQEAEG